MVLYQKDRTCETFNMENSSSNQILNY